jgi:hypothetical protein
MSHRQTSTSGTFSAKITRHEKTSTSRPPSDGDRRARARRPRADRGRSLVRFEDRRDDRQRAGDEQRAERTLQRPRRDQDRDRRCDGAQQRGRTEAGDADREDPAPAIEVAERPADEHERGEQEQVGLDDPLLIGERRIEFLAQRGQGDVDDGLVDEDDRRTEDAGDEGQPLRTEVVHLGQTRARGRRAVRPGARERVY